MAKCKEKGHIFGQMDQNMKVSGRTTNIMEEGSTLLLMVTFMMVTGLTD